MKIRPRLEVGSKLYEEIIKEADKHHSGVPAFLSYMISLGYNCWKQDVRLKIKNVVKRK